MRKHVLQIAWRNLWRNARRTAITAAAIALGYGMLLLFACLLEGVRQQMIENGTRLVLSHLQVHAPDYYPDRSLYHTLGGQTGTDVRALLAALSTVPAVHAASPRVYGYGLVSSLEHSAGADLVGVAPAQEPRVTALHTRIVRGRYLSEQQPRGIVVGDKLADSIRAGVGSEVVIVTQAADGSIGNDLYRVRGIFHTGSDALDRRLVLMPLAALQELLHLEPNRVHEIGVTLADAAEATAVAAAVQRQLDSALPVRVRAWPELAPELAEYVRLNRGATAVLFFIVFLVAVIGVMNTMLMAVFERTREFGVLMALGMRPASVAGLVLAEAGILAALSLLLGGGLSTPLLWYLEVRGLDLRGVIGSLSVVGVVLDPVWYGRHDVATYLRAAAGLALTAVGAALYPAIRAARFRPVDAMRKV
ncbi:MAG: ABC transporter permease [Thermodesulfobacteriota bacterium]